MIKRFPISCFLLLVTSIVIGQNQNLYSAYTILTSDKKANISKKEITKLLEEHPKLTFEFMDMKDKAHKPDDYKVLITTMQELPDFKPIDKEIIDEYGVGLTESDITNVTSPVEGILIDAFYNQNNWKTTEYELNNLIATLAVKYKATIIDEETREIINPVEFKNRKTLKWDNGIPDVQSLINNHFVENNDETCSAITMGMAKFGYPDIVFNQFPCQHKLYYQQFSNLIAQTIVEQENGFVPAQIYLNIDSIKNEFSKNNLLAFTDEGANKGCLITWDLIELDENNKSYKTIAVNKVTDYKGENITTYNETLKYVFGDISDKKSKVDEKQDSVKLSNEIPNIGNDNKEASKENLANKPDDVQGKMTQSELKEWFVKTKSQNENILVLVNMESFYPDSNTENLWLEINFWGEELIKGVVVDKQFNRNFFKDINLGDKISINEIEILDYEIVKRVEPEK